MYLYEFFVCFDEKNSFLKIVQAFQVHPVLN